MTDRLTVASLSAAMDGGLTAIADVAAVLDRAGKLDDGRLIGGVAVLLHQQRLVVDLHLRATADADFGLAPYLLREPDLITAIEDRGYRKVAGNRWERQIDDLRVAAVDLLVPSYTSRARETIRIGDTVTTEVPGLAEALRRPGVPLDIDVALANGTSLAARVVIPDPAATLGLKAWARVVRNEDRDADDLWRCLEIAHTAGVTADTLRDDDTLGQIIPILEREMGPTGESMRVIISGLNEAESTRRRTRIRALLAEVAGITS